MAEIFVNGIRFYYDLRGSGPNLVFISGLATDHTVWDASLFENDFTVLTFDNRGSGRSETTHGPYTLEQLAKDAASLCRALNIEKAHFVGHSMGGHIVQYLGAYHPEIAEKLVIACSGTHMLPISYLATKTRIDLEPFNLPQKIIAENYLPLLLSRHYLEENDLGKKFVEKLINDPFPQSDIGYKAQVEALRKHDTRNILHKIKNQTLIIGCEEDLLTPLESSFHLKEAMPNAVLHIIKKSGHLPYVEKPQEFYSTILKFLTQ